jgi:phage terminase large subunit-like protein
MPVKKTYIPPADLLDLVVGELDSSLRHPSILAYQPYPEQERFHRSDAFGRYISGGNRGGKTNSLVAELIFWGTNTHPYLKRPETWGHRPLQQRVIVVDIEKGINQIILPKLKQLVPRSEMVEGSFDKSWDSKGLIFTFANGSTIDFLTYGMALERQGGVPRHIVYFDEIPPQEIFIEGMMRLIDYGGRWVIAATSIDGMGWTYDEIVSKVESGELIETFGEGAKVDIFYMTQDMNPYLAGDRASRGKYYIGQSDEEVRIRREGEFVAKTGLVFPNFKKETHVIEQMMPPRDWKWYSSVDFGWNNPTAWLWHAVSPQGDIVTFAEHYTSKMTIPQHVATVLMREAAWRRTPEMRVGDPHGDQVGAGTTTGMSMIQEYAIRGIGIGTQGIPRGPGAAMIGVEKMQQYFQVHPHTRWGDNRPKWVVTSNCVNLIRELSRLHFARYESSKKAYDSNALEEIHKKDDHAFDSARYFATLMPNLAPGVHQESDKVPTTVSYVEMMARLQQDATVSFVDSEESNQTEWSTEFEEAW